MSRRIDDHRRRGRVVPSLLCGVLLACLASACGQPPSGPQATTPPSTTVPTSSDEAVRNADVQRLLRGGPTRTGPTEPSDTPARDGVVVTSWSPGPDARTLRLHFTGTPAVSGPCSADYRAEQWASPTAVVVAVLVLPQAAPSSGVACPAIAALRTVDVTLREPPGGRSIISLAGGALVPRTTGQVDGIPVR